MKIAIVGSRDWPEPNRIFEYVRGWRGHEIVSGGARGVDGLAVRAAKFFGIQTKVFPADWKTHGKRAGFLRNQEIVDYCDELVAFWDGESPGTADSIAKAKAAGKPVAVYNLKTGEWELTKGANS